MKGATKRRVISVERCGDFVRSTLICGHTILYPIPQGQSIDTYVQFCQQYVGKKNDCGECTQLFLLMKDKDGISPFSKEKFKEKLEAIAGVALQESIPALQEVGLKDIAGVVSSELHRRGGKES